jgi:hypothetical protein
MACRSNRHPMVVRGIDERMAVCAQPLESAGE